TIVLTKKAPNTKPIETIVYETLDFEEDVIVQLNSILYKHHLISVIVEGGAQMLQAFIKKGLWDEARIFTSPNELNKGLKAPDIDGEILVEKPLLNDQLKILLND
ncbi:MAG: dihydrofolate reductase family protein, partial [Flavobacteriaceae bacterium]